MIYNIKVRERWNRFELLNTPPLTPLTQLHTLTEELREEGDSPGTEGTDRKEPKGNLKLHCFWTTVTLVWFSTSGNYFNTWMDIYRQSGKQMLNNKDIIILMKYLYKGHRCWAIQMDLMQNKEIKICKCTFEQRLYYRCYSPASNSSSIAGIKLFDSCSHIMFYIVCRCSILMHLNAYISSFGRALV